MAPSSTAISQPNGPEVGKGTILLVDDDVNFRSALADTLRDDGYEVVDYNDPVEVPPLHTMGDFIALITDYRMVSCDGVALADRFHAAHADVPTIMTTSYSTAPLESEVAQRPFLHLLCKPIDYSKLVTLFERP
jgi:DNA-binding NtrC family response regulator